MQPIQVKCIPAGATVSTSESESMTAVLLRGFAAVAAAADKASASDVETLRAWRSFCKAAAAACRSVLASSCRAMQHLTNAQTGWDGSSRNGMNWTSCGRINRRQPACRLWPPTTKCATAHSLSHMDVDMGGRRAGRGGRGGCLVSCHGYVITPWVICSAFHSSKSLCLCSRIRMHD